MSSRTSSNVACTPARNTNDCLRAMIQFSKLPAGHGTFKITDDDSAPHLKRHEFAVIDMTNKKVQNGELFLIQYDSGPRSRHVVQVTKSMAQITEYGPKQEVWWTRALAGWRQVGVVEGSGGVPIFAGLSDGPYRAEHLQAKLIGGIVGYANTALGFLIAPEAGYENEAHHNAMFDAGEYLDTLIRTGHRPYLYGEGARQVYSEEMPRGVQSKEDHDAVMAVRWKYVRASKAKEMVWAECLRRGLVG